MEWGEFLWIYFVIMTPRDPISPTLLISISSISFFFFFLCTTSGAINGTFLFVKLNVDLIEACLRVSTSLL